LQGSSTPAIDNGEDYNFVALSVFKYMINKKIVNGFTSNFQN